MSGLIRLSFRSTAPPPQLYSSASVSESMKARVLLADDHERMLQDMEELVSSDFEVIAKVKDGLAAVEAAARLMPDLIITDLAMPGLTGIEASSQVLKSKPNTPIVLVTMHPDPQVLDLALKIGIRGFVHKLTADEELLPASHAAMSVVIFIS